MILKQCLFTANRCYKANEKINGIPFGIVVHSTGANNKTLKRYVQPLKTDANYDEIIADIGVNKYNNHWNKSTGSKCVHAMIGVNAQGVVETYQTLPYNICCWGVGSGKKGSYNYNPTACLQFEILEDNLKDEVYFNAAFKEAIEYCAYLCKQFGLTAKDIRSHKESHTAGYGSNHGDCDNWLKKFGKTMDWFRGEVELLLKAEEKQEEPIIEETVYTVKGDTLEEIAKMHETTVEELAIYNKIEDITKIYVGQEIKIPPKTEKEWIPAVGDTVLYNGTVHYTNANGTTASKCVGGIATISRIYDLRSKHPYHLIRVPEKGATVYGWVDKDTFTQCVEK